MMSFFLSCYFHVPRLFLLVLPRFTFFLSVPPLSPLLPSSFSLCPLLFPLFLAFLSCALVLRPLISPSVCSSHLFFPFTRILLFHPVHLFTLFLRFSLCVSPSPLLSLLPSFIVFFPPPSALSPFICTLSTALFSFLIPLRSFQLVLLRLPLLFQHQFPSFFFCFSPSLSSIPLIHRCFPCPFSSFIYLSYLILHRILQLLLHFPPPPPPPLLYTHLLQRGSVGRGCLPLDRAR